MSYIEKKVVRWERGAMEGWEHECGTEMEKYRSCEIHRNHANEHNNNNNKTEIKDYKKKKEAIKHTKTINQASKERQTDDRQRTGI